MISVNEALQRVIQAVTYLPAQCIPTDQALGLVLAQDLRSPVDVPAFRKSLMDGVAVCCEDFDRHGRRFAIRSTAAAGDAPGIPLAVGEACRIMTGAPVPPRADAVVPHEQLVDVQPDWATATAVSLIRRPSPRQNMLEVGEITRAGDPVLRAGTRISAAVRALLMELGLANVSAYPSPSAAVLSSGSELVDWPQEPPPGCIRNTNGPMLAALLSEFGCRVNSLGIVPDDREVLSTRLRQGLAADLLVITGGVSVGDYDLVPSLLNQLGVEEQFHGVAMKPGKPIWFGTCSGRPVFGLPGNPLSAFVGFHLFVRPAIAALSGQRCPPGWRNASLTRAWRNQDERDVYMPARQVSEGDTVIEILPWKGSSDLRTLAAATGLVRFASGSYEIATGDPVPYLPLHW